MRKVDSLFGGLVKTVVGNDFKTRLLDHTARTKSAKKTALTV